MVGVGFRRSGCRPPASSTFRGLPRNGANRSSVAEASVGFATATPPRVSVSDALDSLRFDLRRTPPQSAYDWRRMAYVKVRFGDVERGLNEQDARFVAEQLRKRRGVLHPPARELAERIGQEAEASTFAGATREVELDETEKAELVRPGSPPPRGRGTPARRDGASESHQGGWIRLALSVQGAGSPSRCRCRSALGGSASRGL